MKEYVYTLRSKLLEKVIKEYIDYVSNPYNMWRQKLNVNVINGEETINDGDGIKAMPLKTKFDYDSLNYKEVMTIPKPRYEVAKAQIIAIVDTLYRHSLNAKEENFGWFYVPSKFLKKASNNYNYILDTLFKLRIILISRSYEESRYGRIRYQIADESMFHLQRTDSIFTPAKKYIQTLEAYANMVHIGKLAEIAKAIGNHTFVERYNKSLSKLTIKEKEALNYINNKYSTEKDKYRRKARENTIYKISRGKSDYKKELRSIDGNGRLYHIGTELQRDLKKFTNIQYTIDCKNSHPFLFSYILLRNITKDIKISESYDDISFHFILRNVLSYLKENAGHYYHYMFSDILRKNLDNNKISKLKRAKVLQYLDKLEGVKEDVWQYIYDVSEGKLWDMFVDTFNEDRTIVKQKVFASVMYSYYSEKPKEKEENAKWIKMFSGLYPTVFKAIYDIKKTLHLQCKSEGKVVKLENPKTVYIGNYKLTYTDKDEVMLPLMLMKLESKIFTQILTKLFNKRICCFGIHDAIAVINSKFAVEDIKAIMLDVYSDYGLIPTLSVDYYSIG